MEIFMPIPETNSTYIEILEGFLAILRIGTEIGISGTKSPIIGTQKPFSGTPGTKIAPRFTTEGYRNKYHELKLTRSFLSQIVIDLFHESFDIAAYDALGTLSRQELHRFLLVRRDTTSLACFHFDKQTVISLSR